MRIDAHQHYWKIDRGDYDWLTPELPQLYRDFLPHDLLPHLKEQMVDGTIVVQAAQTLEETDYLLKLAETTDSILGVVGWLDLNAPDYAQHYERFQAHPKFLGFRVMIQEMTNASAILEPHFVDALKWFAQREVPIDLLVISHQLEFLVELLKEVPDLRGVIDHIAKPRIADAVIEPWASQMKEIAKHPNLYCKLSGMVTEADHKEWKLSDFTSYIRLVLEAFGPNRVMFGSDWPVCLLAASYDEVVNVLVAAIPDSWTDQDKERLFGLNAKAFYKC
ncbi:amidohydrolase [Paenibacillus baekrokdamisoli]|uniref:Amidohydrolase n=1 Tax=Paenibacillus baekrokdamisoli TaxID=1712516 RepID=A0A3G9IZ43_9BACL|nr:amidohydrolase family protein [Paenibacillus baekrokdamisoli]MBB3070424.1 L-fuconolactonase [Paenibacillus baekrokdamisoli]BBH21425.1 amidohydrolase [Paenibacillus baekrokdamisoli]